ncbi:MAG: hypothetical protein WDN30_14355 [Pararobbsia sp.]
MNPIKILILRTLTRKGELCVHELAELIPSATGKTLSKYCWQLEATGYVLVAFSEGRGFNGGGPKVKHYARTGKPYDDPEAGISEDEQPVDERALDEQFRRDGSDFPTIDMSIVQAMNAIVRAGRSA